MLFALDPSSPHAPFPNAEQAETEPNGLLAVGGDLSVSRLINAYRQGIFPWYSDGQPILWWSPDPRAVLFPQRLKVSRSLRKNIRKRRFTATLDQAFEAVILGCAAPRDAGNETWIVPAMMQAYIDLHRAGYAHSVEIWLERKLVGGLYGVALGQVFFGESMFSRANDASKIALTHLVNTLSERGYRMIDCQIYSPHLQSLGAEEIPRRSFIARLNRWCSIRGGNDLWKSPTPVYPSLPGATS